MKYTYIALILVTVGVCMVIATGSCQKKNSNVQEHAHMIHAASDIVALFPKTPDEMSSRVTAAIDDANRRLSAIITVADDARTFDNTLRAYDYIAAQSDLSILFAVCEIISFTHPDAAMRDRAHEDVLRMQTWITDHLVNNKSLYNACKASALVLEGTGLQPAESYFMTELLRDFERAGLNLPDEQLQRVRELSKELSALNLEFERAISQDNRTIICSKEALSGVDEDTLKRLEKTDDGLYKVGLDYPTYHAIMEHCTSEDTRKKLYHAFANRAYPANHETLNKIIAKRDEIAKLRGFAGYSSLDLDDQMVGSPEKAEAFLRDLIEKSQAKMNREIDELIACAPADVACDNGSIKPWDFAYLKTLYKKKYDVDEQRIAEYFPMSKTIDGLLAIYSSFFSLSFEYEQIQDLWHEDVMLVKVRSKNNDTIRGYLLLDLFPRPNKYTHACHINVIPSVTSSMGEIRPPLSLVIANFTKPTDTKPSLLTRNEVSTFFHEFGHALHAILGSTELASQSGTSVKRDFVELPSQMLEEWLWDKDILRSVSSHYQTNEQLPDDMLDAIVALKNASSGLFVQTQALYSLLALELFAPGSEKDAHAILKRLSMEIKPRITFDDEDHFYAAFGHLTGYAAKYYGYLWSKVFALDVFSIIKEQGLLNSEIGQKYTSCIIGRGGSMHPDILLRDFLGREPKIDAFADSLGLTV